jgi:hypothetical protein
MLPIAPDHDAAAADNQLGPGHGRAARRAEQGGCAAAHGHRPDGVAYEIEDQPIAHDEAVGLGGHGGYPHERLGGAAGLRHPHHGARGVVGPVDVRGVQRDGAGAHLVAREDLSPWGPRSRRCLRPRGRCRCRRRSLRCACSGPKCTASLRRSAGRTDRSWSRRRRAEHTDRCRSARPTGTPERVSGCDRSARAVSSAAVSTACASRACASAVDASSGLPPELHAPTMDTSNHGPRRFVTKRAFEFKRALPIRPAARDAQVPA